MRFYRSVVRLLIRIPRILLGIILLVILLACYLIQKIIPPIQKPYANPGVPDRRAKDLLRWIVTRDPARWRKRSLHRKCIPERRINDQEWRVTFVNHSTVLIQFKEWNILTDPIWSKRCSPSRFIGPKRKHPPGIALADLPPIDLVLLTHNHYDHMDIPTLSYLNAHHRPVLLTGVGNGHLLEKEGIGHVNELAWWQSFDLPSDLTVTFVPAQHFSGRGFLDRNQSLWGGFMIKTPTGQMYFAGDTGYGPHFSEIRRRLGIPRLSFLPIGTYDPRWFMAPVHMSPDGALQAHKELGSQVSVGIHFGTFQLSDEGLFDPIIRLRQEMAHQGIPEDQFWVLEPGETRVLDEARAE